MKTMSLETMLAYFLTIPIYILLPAILIIVFLVLSFVYRAYTKKIEKINPYAVLILGYFILAINI